MKYFVEHILDNIVLQYGYGPHLYDTTGKEYLDFACGIFVTNLGHCVPEIVTAIQDQTSRLQCSYTIRTEIRERFIDELCAFTGYESAALFSSGTEATEAAWKVMRTFSGKPAIWGLPGAFHGKTLGARIMAGKEMDRRYAQPVDMTCGFIMEPYEALFARLHKPDVMNRYNTWKETRPELMLCVDEIQAGFGRTGKLFGYEHYPGLKPDLVCIGKALGNGFPISAVLGPKKMICEPIFELSSTHGGNPVACAAGLATIQYYQEQNIIALSEERGILMQELLAALPVQTCGVGMVGAIFLNHDLADKLVLDCAKEGLILVHTGSTTVKIGPPVNISKELLRTGFKIIGKCLSKI